MKQNFNDVVERYKFKTNYFETPEKLRDEIISKTVIPHQVEFQPGSSGKKNLLAFLSILLRRVSN